MTDDFIKYISQFVDLSVQDFELLMNKLKRRSVASKEKLTSIGETENYLYFIIKGVIRKYFVVDKEEIITQIAKENSIISSSVSFLNGNPSDYCIEAIEPSELFTMHKEDLEALYRTHTKFEKLGRLITLDWLMHKEILENDRLQLTTKERFLKFAKNNQELMERVPQKYLASFLNIQPETFSRYKHLIKP